MQIPRGILRLYEQTEKLNTLLFLAKVHVYDNKLICVEISKHMCHTKYLLTKANINCGIEYEQLTFMFTNIYSSHICTTFF